MLNQLVEKMFDNPGRKIQEFAKKSFKLTLIMWIVIGILAGAILCSFGEFMIVVGVLVIILVPVIACASIYVYYLKLISYGQMIENVESLEDDTGHFRLSGMMTKPYSKEEAEADREKARSKEMSTDKNEGSSNSQPAKPEMEIACRNCGTRQHANHQYCVICGAEL